MNIDIKQPQPSKERPFPKLMMHKKNKDNIVYALSPGSAFDLTGNPEVFPLMLEMWRDFEGTITLSND